jgi:septum site-determining protein MinC
VDTAAQPSHPIRFRGRSFLAFTLTPTPPVAEWLAELDKSILNSPGFFVGRPVVLDLAAVTLSESAIGHLVSELGERGIRIMGFEGTDPGALGPQLPPVLTGGRPGGEERTPDPPRPAPGPAEAPPPEAAQQEAAQAASATQVPPAGQVPPQQARSSVVTAADDPPPREPCSLLIESPIRSGQSVVFPFGDVTVLGSVASGAEIVAGGSIHIYGALRGRAMAGSTGDARARIFCRRNEAELIAIDGYYRTAEETEAELRGRPVQIRLDGVALKITALE